MNREAGKGDTNMHTLTRRLMSVLIFSVMTGSALPAGASEALYLANEGILVRDGETKVLFDPLFENGFGQYQLMPERMQRDLLSGQPPFDNVDAVFVSHAHGDHFSARLILAYLRAQPVVVLYAPAQAVTALRAAAGDGDQALFSRVTGIALDNSDDVLDFRVGDLSLRVFRVPHSGWPDRRTDIENLVFQVTLKDGTTVAHFGDADANPRHFRATASLWDSMPTDLAVPPYWFLTSGGGKEILQEIVQADRAVGSHVPTSVPDDPTERQPELLGLELFTEPGQVQAIRP